MSLASQIDLNTLDALSSTCHQIRINLLQSRAALMDKTLHCDLEDIPLVPYSQYPMRHRPGSNALYLVEAGEGDEGRHTYKYCARDLVGRCARCDAVVCRVSLIDVFYSSLSPFPVLHISSSTPPPSG